jgi:5-methylcytosine-specific restriction endonuclease McrA
VVSLINISLSGKTKIVNTIYSDEPCIKSRASYELLVNYLKQNDEDYINKTVKLKNYLIQRAKFLFKEKIKNNGNLVCSYCGKNHLIIGYLDLSKININNYKFKKLATIDHIIPVSSELINPLDETNWTVSCIRCNKLKGNGTVDDLMKKIKPKTKYQRTFNYLKYKYNKKESIKNKQYYGNFNFIT